MTLDREKEYEVEIHTLYRQIVKDYICSNMTMERKSNEVTLTQGDGFGGETYLLPNQQDFDEWLKDKFQIK